MKPLTEKQIFNQLNKYYKEHYGENDTDEWFVNPKENIWKFIRNNQIIILEYNIEDGKIKEQITDLTNN